MTRDEFWFIIEESRRQWDAARSDGNMDRQLRRLIELLSPLPTAEVESFALHAAELYYAAYRWDLWHAAYIIGQGCSDDAFMDFRGWLISMGRAGYEQALANVESLCEMAAAPGVEDIFFEGFMSAPAIVYEMQTSKELDVAPPHPGEPAGHRVPEDEFPVRFPKLWKKFGTP